MSDICPSAEKCPIFTGILKDKGFTTRSYRSHFCEAGIEGRNNCMRFKCKQKYGKVPDDLLPNSGKSLEEIGEDNSWK